MRTVLLAALLLSGCGLIAWPGKVCRKHEDCVGLKSGYCARAEICTKECSDTVTCPEGSTCSEQGSRRVCLQACEQDSECPTGFMCGGGVCVLRAPLEPPPT